MIDVIYEYLVNSGFGQLELGNLVMIGVGCLFIYLAIKHGFEPLLLVPIGFGILIGNIPYNSAKLSLSVYDGPVSEHDINYYQAEIDDVFINGEQYTRDDAWQAIQERLFKNEEQRTSVEPWNHEKLVTLVNNTDTVYLSNLRKIESHIEGSRAVEDGAAIMVNTHALFSAATKVEPEGKISARIEALGQGRMVVVADETMAKSGKFPQFWSIDRQDPHKASVFWALFTGVGMFGFYPPLIFLGVGVMTDFGPMLANPKTLLLGAAAQFGIFGALLGAVWIFNFTLPEAAAIGIIGGADGPTAIFTCATLAPHLLGAVALAAYSYMALVPIIQPPIMRALTSTDERKIRMTQAKPVSKLVKIMFPIVGFLLTAFIANGALPLLGMLFFGNLLRESMVTDRLAKTAQSAFIDIVTILLGVTVGAKTNAANFLTMQTIFIFVLGVVAFGIATATGVLFAKGMNALATRKILFTEKVNPLIGAAGVSAVPMAARVAHRVGQEEDPQNFLLMHAMGPNVAGVIGSAVAAGVLLSSLAK